MAALILAGVFLVRRPTAPRIVGLVLLYWLVALFGLWACCFAGVAELLAGAADGEPELPWRRRLLARPRSAGDFRLLFFAAYVAASGVLCAAVLRLLGQ